MEDLKNKLIKISDGMESAETNENSLKAFYLRIAESNPDTELSMCLIEASDRLNESAASLFNRLYDASFDASVFRSVIFLFDENIDLGSCTDLLFDFFSVLRDNGLMNMNIVDEIVKDSPNQETFEKNIKKYMLKFEVKSNKGPEETESIEREFINHLKAENEKLTKQVFELKTEIKDCKKKETSHVRESLETESQKNRYFKELEDLKADLSKLTLTLAFSEKKCERLQVLFSQEQAHSAILSKQAKAMPDMSEYEALRNKLHETEEKLSVYNDEKMHWIEEKDALLKDNDILKKDMEELSSAIGDMESKISSLEDQNEALNDEISALRDVEIVKPSASKKDEDACPEEKKQFYSGFTESIINDEEKEEYSDEDVISITNNRTNLISNCNIFTKIFSAFFEMKFKKKPQVEQNRLVFIKLCECAYSQQIVPVVRQAIEDNDFSSRYELYKMICNKKSEDDIVRFCKEAH